MESLQLVGLLVYSFGFYVCVSVLASMARAQRPDGTQRPPSIGRALRSIASVSAARWNFLLLGLCAVWFAAHTLRELVSPGEARNWIDLVRFNLSLLFPPILMESNYHETHARRPLTHPAWRVTLATGWIASVVAALYYNLAVFRLVPRPASLGVPISFSFVTTFSLAGVFCALALSIGRKHRETTAERRGRRSMVALYGVLLLFAATIAIATLKQLPIEAILNVAGGSLPLVFMFTGTYHESRFEFVELFVKRGVYFAAAWMLLGVSLAWILPALERIAPGPGREWILALLLLPLAIVLPWIHRSLSRWLDAWWLGRLLPPVEAIKRFLAGLRDAVTREQLIEQADAGLSAIFRAPARVRLGGSGADDPFDTAIEVPVRSGADTVGTILMGPRENHIPYSSEDRLLIGSLADVLSHMLENIDLQARRQEQETRARELSLAASRSELKALRAQINPHFLFNALNAIAGLIHKDPGRADETLEQLAEIFRYTLRGSESEWAVLSEEIDFVHSYLEVERARFGRRLEVEVSVPREVAPARLPTMLLQTLVENAIKHGVAVVRGPARVEIGARADGDSLILEVRDSGPGFPAAHDAASARQESGSRRSGYGLRNVRERLAGHYGERASLGIHRDEVRGFTVVSLMLPLDLGARQRTGAA